MLCLFCMSLESVMVVSPLGDFGWTCYMGKQNLKSWKDLTSARCAGTSHQKLLHWCTARRFLRFISCGSTSSRDAVFEKGRERWMTLGNFGRFKLAHARHVKLCAIYCNWNDTFFPIVGFIWSNNEQHMGDHFHATLMQKKILRVAVP